MNALSGDSACGKWSKERERERKRKERGRDKEEEEATHDNNLLVFKFWQ
jgi:hypothetical protein